ncbi:hypothetical protein J437_LFUL011523 [Ladona fulva]|uniref:Uncharacterized protein n=1 Tax=Ladona fulva TaxID=123851 RepID=A0A8K0K9J3_LADFU|nr:hypothetical protein J437_LFUL011523 [Ladona fulva]
MWKASGDDPALFYVISAAWGVCNAIWEVLTFITGQRESGIQVKWNAFQLLCLTGVLSFFPALLVSAYPCEGDSWQGALALGQALRLCGLALALSLHHTLCTSVKVYVLSAALPLSVAPYAFLEARLQRKRRRAPDILAAL